MNITQLKYFQAIATYHTVSNAAQHLYISQPSLSNAIKELEREFAVSLFYRRHNGMFLTPEGTKLYNATQELLSRYDEVERMMHHLGKDTKQLRLGIPPMISSFIFADIYKNFVLPNTDMELMITEKGRYELLEQLNDGLLDVVLLPHTKPFDISISAKKIGTLEIVCCTSKSNSLSEHKAISPKMLAKQPLVLFSDTFFQTKTIKNWFARESIEPNISIQTEQLSTAQNMIENDIAIGFMFKKLAKKNASMETVSLDPPIFVDISVLRKKDAYALDGIKKLERYFEESSPFEKGANGVITK